MLTLLLLAQLMPANPEGPIFTNPSSMGATAFFELFPSSGRGTAGPCSTTAPTGAKGETLTFGRPSNGTCTKTAAGGLSTTGIANGDLVVLSSNQPRVEYDNGGTLGLLVESSRTNYALRSSEIGVTAPWVTTNNIGAPTVTANACTAPDGTLTATRVQFPATNAGSQYSVVRQNLSTLVAGRASIFMRSYPDAGTQSTYINDGSVGSRPVTKCTVTEASWSRCEVSWSAAAGDFDIGPNTYMTGQDTVQPTADVCVWGSQAEPGNYVTSYIPTTNASVARSAETAEVLSLMPSNTTRSLAFTLSPVPGMAWGGSGGTVQWSGGASGAALTDPYFWPYSNGGKINLETRTTGAPSPAVVSGLPLADLPTTAGSSARIAAYMKSTHIGLCQNSTCLTEVAFTPGAFTFTRLLIGFGPGQRNDAIWSRICADPDPLRCR